MNDMSIQFQKKYWSEDEFIRENGQNYKGYVGIYDNQGYIYGTQQKLKKSSTYYTQFNSGKYFFDRILDEQLKLPYGKKQTLFQANDFLYKGTFKDILYKLQANNDFIYKCSTISDTLIPVVDDCSILATTNNSKFVFVGKSGQEYEQIPDIINDKLNTTLSDVQSGYIINPNWDTSLQKDRLQNENSEKYIYPLIKGAVPKETYPSKWYKIPNTKYNLDLDYGKLTRYNMLNQKQTKTALDSTFYSQQLQDGTKTTPLYPFDDIVASEMVITDVGMQKIGISESGVRGLTEYDELKDGQQQKTVKRIRLLIFLAFKTKISVIRYIYYPDDFYVNNWLGGSIDFNQGTNDVINLTTVDPSNKNSVTFLGIKDIRVRGNYLYVVDEKLSNVLRYDIEFIRSHQGVMAWNAKSIRLIDMLQGQGDANDEIFFNKPCSICANDQYIYVADRGNGCIKRYSTDFTYINTIRNGNFVDHDIQTISINPYAFTLDDGTVLSPNSLWIFTTVGSSMFVHVIDGKRAVYSHRISKLNLLEDKFMWNQQFKSVKFSFTNSNYYYICTTKRVYKIHLSKPFYPFASLSYFKQRMLLTTMVWSRVPYEWHMLPCGQDESGIDVTWGYRPATTSAEILDNKAFCLCGVDDYTVIDSAGNRAQFNGDMILHIGTLYNQSKIDTFCKRNNCTFYDIPQHELATMINCSGFFLYNETDSYLTSLTRLNFPAYITQEIEDLDSSQYVNPNTFNKMIYKVIYNLVNLKNHIIGRFWGSYNIDGLMVYDQLEYDDYFQQMRIENNDDFFVHQNEPMSILINRIFEKVIDVQQKLLRRMEAKYRAQGAFTNNSFRII